MRSLLRPKPPQITGWLGGLLLVGLALAVSSLDIVPVRSQNVLLTAKRTEVAPRIDDPWDPIWVVAPSQYVVLSAQQIAPPFGGGTIDSLIVRALHDDERLYVLVEWEDTNLDDAVNGVAEFSDAVAVQFPAASSTGVPPFTMGGPSTTVNIWHWKAVWQRDIDSGFASLQDRYPNTYADFYPNADDPLYRTAEFVGNPLAQRTHDSPVENLIAEGFGTLTHSDAQLVEGSGAWREGRWRAVFARSLASADLDQAQFELGEPTQIAFAVWDGGSDDRNGQKSIAPFIDFEVGDADALGFDGAEFGGTQILIVVVIALSLGSAASLYAISRRRAVS